MRVGQIVTVNSCKHDGSIQRIWQARLQRLENSLIVLEGTFADEVKHPLLGTIVEGTISTEFFWTDRWYSIFRFREPSGELRHFYCNVNTPVRFEKSVLSFVDLDIDVLIAPDFSHRILDEDEFAEHAVLYGYPPEYYSRVQKAVKEILSLMEKRSFPFSLNVTVENSNAGHT